MTQLKDNMSSIEKIRQEIERRIENYWSDGDVDSVVVSGELEELLAFIDSLPEEKPSEDLEEAAEKYSDKYCSDWAYRLEYEAAFIDGGKVAEGADDEWCGGWRDNSRAFAR